MKKVCLAVAVAAASLAGAASATDVGVSVSIGQPGFYGRLDIGGYPPPQVVYAQPVVIAQEPEYGPPVYLRVPPGHMKHWRRYCGQYNACGERVYFVRDNWYHNEYLPRYRERPPGPPHGWGPGRPWREGEDRPD